MTATIGLSVGLMLLLGNNLIAHADPTDPVDPASPTPTVTDTTTPPEVTDPATPPEVTTTPTASTNSSGVSWLSLAQSPTPQVSDDGLSASQSDWAAIDDGTYSDSATGLNQATKLPSKWNLRDNKPEWCPAVRDVDGFSSTFWAFASAKAAESNLVKKGVFASTSTSSQVSALHTVQSVYLTNTFASDISAPLTANSGNPYMSGGNSSMVAAAWSHLYGPQTETTCPYPTDFTTNPTNCDLQSQAYNMQNWWKLPRTYTSKGKFSMSNVNTIKNAVYKYGAINTGLFFPSYIKNDPVTSSFYMYDPFFHKYNWELVIIGWDDSISKNNFNALGHKPAGNGAFLVQNELGDDSTSVVRHV